MNLPIRQTLLIGTACTGLLLFSACATNPVSGKNEIALVSEAQEVAMGTDAYPKYQQIEGAAYALDPGLSAYVDAVGQKLVKIAHRPHLPYEFVVLNSDVANAWALPGGKIALNRGLLLVMENEAEMAAVIAHEIVHAAARHSAQRMERGTLMQIGLIGIAGAAGEDYSQSVLQVGSIGAGLVGLNYSRSAEAEADRVSMDYLYKAGYHPQAAVALQETFIRLHGGGGGGWLATHPSSNERAAANRAQLSRYPDAGYLGESEYRVKTAGIRKNAKAYTLHQEAVKELSEKDYNAARDFAREAQKLEPREAHFYGTEAKALLGLKKDNEALKKLNQAIQRNPNYFEFYLQRGLLHEKRGRKQSAINDLKASMNLLPTQPGQDALARLGAQ